MDFIEKLRSIQAKNNTLLCVGLDPDSERLPKKLLADAQPFFQFNKTIIDATADLVCAFKPNSAFYEARGDYGIKELLATCEYIKKTYPEIPIILDFKRGDIGNTNAQSAVFAFDYLGVDAVTVQPYQGKEALQPFLDRRAKGIIVLCKTSNTGSKEFQDLAVEGKPLYLHVAEHVKNEWNAQGNCLLVVGATYPDELAHIRSLVGDEMTFLVPGLGAQGADSQATVKAGLNSAGAGLIINSSRAIIYASEAEDYAEAARSAASRSRDEINSYR